MKTMVDNIEALNGKTIQSIRYQRDDDFNQGVLINTTDGDICFLVGGMDDDHDIWTQTISGLSKFNVKVALELGIITQEEHDLVIKNADESDNRQRIGTALRCLDEVKAKQPELLNEFLSQLRERIPNGRDD